jgi:replicative DNA helicase
VYRPIRELVGRSGFRVSALNPETWRLESRVVTNAFATGRKPVYRLRTRLGRTIRATGNHKFLSFSGWRRLDDLGPGARVALPRRSEGHGAQTMSDAEVALLGHLIGDGCTLPRHTIQYTTKDRDVAELLVSLATEVFGDSVRPRINPERTWLQVYLPSARRLTHGVRNPIAQWLDEMGVFGLRSWEKRVPEKVFAQPPHLIATFLRHLWATDGCLYASAGKHYPVIRYDSSSEELARDVQSLLLRLSINARRWPVSMGAKGRTIHRLDIQGRDEAIRFLNVVSAAGARKRQQRLEILLWFDGRVGHTNRDVVPKEAWRSIVVPAMQQAGVTTRALQERIDTRYSGSTLYKAGLARERALLVADAVDSNELAHLATSDVYWDQITSIEADGEEEVYDLTVEGLHNFVADDVIAHNSIEQDADLVMFVYRDEYYNEESDQQGLAEIILSKHRNGPTGVEKLSFLKRYAKFADLAS